MAATTFVAGTLVTSDWLNSVDYVIQDIMGGPSTLDVTFAGGITCTEFTSNGIDDNTTGTVMTLADTGVIYGVDLRVNDNNSLIVGTGNDFTIEHTGTATNIDNDTGNVTISENVNSGTITVKANNSSGTSNTVAEFGGGTSTFIAYHEGTKVLSSTPTGLLVGDGQTCGLTSSNSVSIITFDSADIIQFTKASNTFEIKLAATTELRVTAPSSGEVSLWVYDSDNATLERVTVGAADSGGSGFKLLRIPN